MSLDTPQAIAVNLESPAQSRGHKHESSNLLQPAFEKAIERAADKQAAADQAALSSALAHPDGKATLGNVPEASNVANENGFGDVLVVETDVESSTDELSDKSSTSAGLHSNELMQFTEAPSSAQTPVTTESVNEQTASNPSDEAVQAYGITPASQRLDTNEASSIDKQGVVSVDNDTHPIAISEPLASSQPIIQSTSASPEARGGVDQQTYDTLSHLLSRPNTLNDSQSQALTLKVIAGMPEVESMKVQQDQSGQWHLLLQLNPNSRRSEEQHRSELLAELSRRGHTMGSVSIFTSADSMLAEQEI
ncbi:MAG: hypothetical protein AB8B97_11420 [Granulosicoccus sp.]